MIFRCGLSAEVLAKLDQGKIEAALLELLRACRLGYHLLVLERQVALYFLAAFELGGKDRAMLQRIHDDYSTLGKLPFSS